MKVLQVNVTYGTGSTGKIVQCIHNELIRRDNYQSVVCYGRGSRVDEVNLYKVSNEIASKIRGYLYKFNSNLYGQANYSTFKLINIIKREKPDIVHLHCLNGFFVNIYKLIDYLKYNNIKTVLTLHAEFMYTGNCGVSNNCTRWKTGCGSCPKWKQMYPYALRDRTAVKWSEMKKAFDGFSNLIVVSVSPWLMNQAKCSLILGDKHNVVVMNGLDNNIFRRYQKNEISYEIRELFIKKTILHVTPSFMSGNKGGKYVVELAKQMPEYNFIVVGAKGDELVPSNVRLIKHTNNQQELAMYYNLADVTLLTSQRETFSMVLAESLCCGTPFVGFKAGGPESIAMEDCCSFVEYGDIDKLRELLIETCNKTFDREHISEEAQKKYSIQQMVENYIKLYSN